MASAICLGLCGPLFTNMLLIETELCYFPFFILSQLPSLEPLPCTPTPTLLELIASFSLIIIVLHTHAHGHTCTHTHACCVIHAKEPKK